MYQHQQGVRITYSKNQQQIQQNLYSFNLILNDMLFNQLNSYYQCMQSMKVINDTLLNHIQKSQKLKPFDQEKMFKLKSKIEVLQKRNNIILEKAMQINDKIQKVAYENNTIDKNTSQQTTVYKMITQMKQKIYYSKLKLKHIQQIQASKNQMMMQKSTLKKESDQKHRIVMTKIRKALSQLKLLSQKDIEDYNILKKKNYL